jgi:hypothetical protein
MKTKTFNLWNRKLHIHLGLFLLLFIWLFSLSGLLLNHGSWKFASFWEEREQLDYAQPIVLPEGMDSAKMIANVMRELKISGEVNNVKLMADALHFRVGSPGMGREMHVDVHEKTVRVKEYRLNIWGKIRTLHTFNGVEKNNIAKEANWFITRVWRFAMDVIALAFIALCVTSWCMWYKIRKEYKGSGLVLAGGFLVCCYFVYLVAIV